MRKDLQQASKCTRWAALGGLGTTMAMLLACGGGGDALTTSPLVWAMDVTTGDGYDGPALTNSDAVSRALVNDGCAPSVTQCVTFDVSAPGFRHKISIPAESLVAGDSYSLDSPQVISEIYSGSSSSSAFYKADSGTITIGSKVGENVELTFSDANHSRISRGGGPYVKFFGTIAPKWVGTVATFETPFETNASANASGNGPIRGPFNVEVGGWEGGPGKPDASMYFHLYSPGSSVVRVSYKLHGGFGIWRFVPSGLVPPPDVLWQQPWPNPTQVWRGQAGSKYVLYAPTGTQTVGKVNMGGSNPGVTLAPDSTVAGNLASGTFKMWGVLAK